MKKKDIILILIVLICAGVGYLIFNTKGIGNTVVITVDGKEYGAYPINIDKKIDVKTDLGHNVVVIEGGKVYIEEADCPDGYCINQGKTDSASKSLICLPHKLVVSVDDKAKSDKDKNDNIDVIVK